MNLTLLTGMPRSGSTYLQKLLSTNPKIKTGNKTCHIPEYISALKRVFEPGKDASSSTIEQTQKEFETFVFGGISANCLNDKNNLFKSRNYILHFDLLNSIFDDVKYIFLIRDLKDIVLSIYNLTKKYNYKDGYDGLSKEERINFILHNSFLAPSLKMLPYAIDTINENREKFFILKYEHLCLNHVRELSRINNFLKIENEYNFDLIDATNYHIDTTYKHTISHEITSKEINFKQYEDDDFSKNIDFNLRKIFANYYNFFNY